MTSRTKAFAVRSLLAAGLAASLLPAAAGTALAGSVIHVKPSATGANTGASWADAYTSLQTALGAAVSGDAIWVAKGTYLPTTGTDVTLSFVIKSGVAMYGGFSGTETSLGQRNPATNLTILSGDIGVSGSAGDNSKHVVTIPSGAGSTVLDGFKVIGGYNLIDTTPGAGVLVDGGSPTLRNLLVSGNSGYAGGGIGVIGGASPLIDRVTVASNWAGGGFGVGGGMNSIASSPTLRNVTFTGNVGTYGGAIEIYQGAVTMTNVTFAGNSVQSYGGGGAVYTDAATVTVDDSILWGDTTDGPYEVVVGSGTVTISNGLVAGGCPADATCSAVHDADPKLGALKSNGGLVPTMAPGPGSAAIDDGSNATCAATDARGVARPQGPSCDVGAVELRVMSFRSVAAYDGWLLESSETSGAAGTLSASATTIRVGDDAKNRQYRSVLSFNTATLPNAAVIVGAKIRVRPAGTVGTNPFTTHGTLVADIRTPSFGTLGLTTGDFKASASRSAAGSFGASPVSGWYVSSIGAAGLAYVSRTSTTQFRLRFTLDDNNDHGADYVAFSSGNASSSSTRPLLQVYYLP